MFFDDDITDLDEQLTEIIGRGRGHRRISDSVEEQARRDFEEILNRRRGGGGGLHEMVGDASNLVKIADDLTKPASATATVASSTAGGEHWDRMATALEDIKNQIGAVVARPSAGARAFAWMSSNPWRVATIVLGLAGAFGVYLHYAPKKNK